MTLFRKPLKLTSSDFLKTPTSVPSTPSVSQLCQKTSSLLVESVVNVHDLFPSFEHSRAFASSIFIHWLYCVSSFSFKFFFCLCIISFILYETPFLLYNPEFLFQIKLSFTNCVYIYLQKMSLRIDEKKEESVINFLDTKKVGYFCWISFSSLIVENRFHWNLSVSEIFP